LWGDSYHPPFARGSTWERRKQIDLKKKAIKKKRLISNRKGERPDWTKRKTAGGGEEGRRIFIQKHLSPRKRGGTANPLKRVLIRKGNQGKRDPVGSYISLGGKRKKDFKKMLTLCLD